MGTICAVTSSIGRRIMTLSKVETVVESDVVLTIGPTETRLPWVRIPNPTVAATV